jgi:hypothetical protein
VTGEVIILTGPPARGKRLWPSSSLRASDAAAEGVVPGRQFVRGQRLEHVELVTIWVGHDHPADVALADTDLPGAECLEPGDFGTLIGGAQIQVEPVLDGLAFGALRKIRSGAMPSSGLPSDGSRQTWSSSSHVRRQPSAASQKLAILARSVASMHKHSMRSSMC